LSPSVPGFVLEAASMSTGLGRRLRSSHRLPRRGVLQKGSGYLIDQALSSGGNFAVSLVVARELGVESFGYFALTMSVWVFLLALLRAAILQPLIVSVGDGTCAAPVARARAVVIAVALGAMTVVGGLIGAAVATGQFSRALGGLALAIIPVLVHEAMRSLALAVGEPWRAVSADLIWVVGTIAVLAALRTTGSLSAGTAVAAWGAGATLGLVPFVRSSYVQFNGAAPSDWFRSNVRTSAAFAGAALSSTAGAQAVVWLVALTLSPAAVGGLKAAQNLMVPGRMAAASVENFFLRRLAGSSSRQVAHETRSFILVGTGSVALWLLVLVAMASFGFPPIQTIFGASFAPFERLVLPLAIASVFACLTVAELLIVRSRLDGGAALRLAVISTASNVAFAPLGALLGGAFGVAVGLLAAEVVLLMSARYMRLRRPVEASQADRTSVRRT
jgi:O-antigen/teichoic acid export membrane protein